MRAIGIQLAAALTLRAKPRVSGGHRAGRANEGLGLRRAQSAAIEMALTISNSWPSMIQLSSLWEIFCAYARPAAMRKSGDRDRP
jgi:hypothetical protein